MNRLHRRRSCAVLFSAAMILTPLAQADEAGANLHARAIGAEEPAPPPAAPKKEEPPKAKPATPPQAPVETDSVPRYGIWIGLGIAAALAAVAGGGGGSSAPPHP